MKNSFPLIVSEWPVFFFWSISCVHFPYEIISTATAKIDGHSFMHYIQIKWKYIKKTKRDRERKRADIGKKGFSIK